MKDARSPVAFGPYVITRRIARGGMAEIYRARARNTGERPGRWVALKMMRSALGHEELRTKLFEREARIASRLVHPNVVPLFEFGQEMGRMYLAMEYVRGRDVSHLLRNEKRGRELIPLELGLYIGLGAARGLGHAHRLVDPESGKALGIVHRDMSPGNVMVGYDGLVKVLDFGVARMNEAQGMQTQTGTLRGKFAYMSPEQTLGEDLDARSDVFSLGTVLYELLTGINCFRAQNPIATLERVQGLRPVPPSRALRGMPKEVDRILARCLAKDRNRRFRDADVLADAIAEFLDRRNFRGQAALAAHLAQIFAWEQHEEDSELVREEEEVALFDVVDFALMRDDAGLDARDVAISTEEEASQSEVKSVALARASSGGDEVFEGEVADSSRPLASPPPPPTEDEDDATLAQPLPFPSPPPQVEEPTQQQPRPALGHPQPRLFTESVAKPVVLTGTPLLPPQPRRRWPALVAAAVVLVAVGGVFAATWSSRGEPQQIQVERTTRLAPVTIELQPPKPAKPPKPAQPLEDDLPDGDAPPEDPPERPQPASVRPPPREERVERERRPPPPSPKKAATGFLNVGAKPWAEIKIDGKPWPYQTPQAGIELPAGKHTVTLSNRETGVNKTTVVYIKPGAYRTVMMDMRKQ